MKEDKSDSVAAAVTYNPVNEKFLVVKRTEGRERFPGRWEFPSGFIKKDESPENAALRELAEETSLTGEIVRTGESFFIETPGVKVHPVLVKTEEENVELSREHEEYQWVEKNELNSLEAVPKLKTDLEKVGIKQVF